MPPRRSKTSFEVDFPKVESPRARSLGPHLDETVDAALDEVMKLQQVNARRVTLQPGRSNSTTRLMPRLAVARGGRPSLGRKSALTRRATRRSARVIVRCSSPDESRPAASRPRTSLQAQSKKPTTTCRRVRGLPRVPSTTTLRSRLRTSKRASRKVEHRGTTPRSPSRRLRSNQRSCRAALRRDFERVEITRQPIKALPAALSLDRVARVSSREPRTEIATTRRAFRPFVGCVNLRFRYRRSLRRSAATVSSRP